MIQSRTAYFLISVLLTGSIGYYVGQSPIPQLQTELNTITQNNTVLHDQLTLFEAENQQFKNQLTELLENITIQNNELDKQIQELEETNWLYVATLGQYVDLLLDYTELLQEYYEGSEKPQGDMSVSLIPGIVNGDWSDGNSGWLTQGMSNLVGGVKFLHEYSSGTYSTQTVYLDSEDQGIQFDMKSQPFGGEITLQVSLKGITVFKETYTGANAEWETVVIPFNCLMTMRDQYGFAVEDFYDVRFTVKSGENTGSNIALDNVSLVKISYD